jgi:hypothetical protein
MDPGFEKAEDVGAEILEMLVKGAHRAIHHVLPPLSIR